MMNPNEVAAGVGFAAAGLTIYESRAVRRVVERRMRDMVRRLANLSPHEKKRLETGLFNAAIRELIKEMNCWAIAAQIKITPAMPEEIPWVAEFEAKHYDEDAVPYPILNDWYKTFPIGFWIFRLPNGTRIGHIDFLPVKKRTLDLFMPGIIIEREIRGDSLHSETERDSITSFYIESLAIDKEFQSVGLRALLRNFNSIMARICNVRRILHLYAIAASPDGLNFMVEGLGFSTVTPAENRTDKHPFLEVKLHDLLSDIEKRFGQMPPPHANGIAAYA